MTVLINSVLLNTLVAAGLALLVWTASVLPAVRRRPGLRQLLWAIVLLKLVTPPLFEITILPPSPAPASQPLPHLPDLPLGDFAGLPVEPTGGALLERSDSPPLTSPIDWTVVLAVVSGLGSLIVLLLAVRQVARLKRALAQGATDDDRVNEIARWSAQRMKISSPPKICIVRANVSPLLWVRSSGPIVVLPRRLVDQMNDEELGCIVSHEIGHLLRRDHRINLISLLVAALCWWNPVVWWARRELRTAQEACCDALVISRSVVTRRTYAETLFRALEFIQTQRPLSPAPASGFGGKSSTRRRFEMIANPHVNHRLPWWSYPLLLAALTALPCVPVHGQSHDAKDAKSSRATQSSTPTTGRIGDLEMEGFGYGDFGGSAAGEGAFGSFGYDAAGEGAYGSFGHDAADEGAYGGFGFDAAGEGMGNEGAFGSYGFGDMGTGAGIGDSGTTGSRPASRKTRYRLPDYLPAAHGNAVSLGGNRYYILTPHGSDRVWYVQFVQDAPDGNGKILWDATLKLPPADKLKQGDTFVLNTSQGIVTIAEVEDDYVNDRDIGVKQIDVKTGVINDKRTLLTHMARYQSFLESMQAGDNHTKENKDHAAGTASSTESMRPSSAYRQSLEREILGQWYKTTEKNNHAGWAILRANVKANGDDLILELDCSDGGKLDRAEVENLYKAAFDIWKRTYGDALVSKILWSRDGRKTRITINGKRRTHRDGSETDGQNPQPHTEGQSGAKVDTVDGIPITAKVEVKGFPNDHEKLIDLDISVESADGSAEETPTPPAVGDKPAHD